MSNEFDSALTYTSYLAVDELLALQKPLSTGPEHDEMLFIIIHQTYELWFKQLIHEFLEAQRALESGNTHYALAILGRLRTIMKVCVAQVDILETMTPLQFNAFRGYLSSSSGFQSAQFRKVEALLGRRDSKISSHLPKDVQGQIKEITSRNSIWDSTLAYLSKRGHKIPAEILERNCRQAYAANNQVEDAWLVVYRNHKKYWDLYQLGEELADLEDAFRLWRFRHLTTVERVIGFKRGTGGTGGVSYLRKMLDVVLFPEIWSLRTSL